MRCLVMASVSSDLGVLHDVLSSHDVDVVLTATIGAGTDLLRADLADIGCGIAVVPPATSTDSGARAAIFLEIGIASARGIQVLVVTEPTDPSIPALGDLLTVGTEITNRTVLAFHIRLFLHRLSRPVTDRTHTQSNTIPSRVEVSLATGSGKTESVVRQLRKMLSEGNWQTPRAPLRENSVVEILEQVLSASGATVHREVGPGRDRIDLAFTHPRLRETVLVEVKMLRPDGASVDQAREQLWRYMQHNKGAIGLVLCDKLPLSTEHISPRFPLIWATSIASFVDTVVDGDLDTFIVRARNQMAHTL